MGRNAARNRSTTRELERMRATHSVALNFFGLVTCPSPTWARKKPSRSAAFFAHMWTTVPSEPRAHRRQVSFLSSLALCDRRPCTRSKSSGFFTADFPMVQDFSIRLTFPVDWVFSALTTGIPRGWVALVMVRPRCKDSFQDGLTVSEFLAGSGSRTLGQFPKKNVYPA